MKQSVTAFLAIVIILTFSVPVSSQGYPSYQLIYNLTAYDMLDVVAQGDTYNTAKITMTRTIDEDIHVVIPAGTFLAARLVGVQDMVVTHTVEIDLTDNEPLEVIVQTASLETQASIPVPGNRFAVFDRFSSPLTNLMAVVGDSDMGFDTIQAAVWIVTENGDWEEMGILRDFDGEIVGYTREVEGEDDEDEGVRLIDEEDVIRAMIQVENAGIDIRRKHIWMDHAAIMENLPSGDLLDWLNQKIEDLL